MLDIGWVFAGKCDYRELISILTRVPDEAFKTDLVISLNAVFEIRYKTGILKWAFIPYTCYVIMANFFLNYSANGIHNINENKQIAAVCMGILILIVNGYLVLNEIYAIIRDSRRYMNDSHNYVDLITIILMIGIVIETLAEKESDSASNREWI